MFLFDRPISEKFVGRREFVLYFFSSGITADLRIRAADEISLPRRSMTQQSESSRSSEQMCF